MERSLLCVRFCFGCGSPALVLVLEKRLWLFRWPNALLSKTPGSLMNLELSLARASTLDFHRDSVV
jgi:hypothetical protein